MTLVDPKFISLTTIQVGKRIKDKKERVFGSKMLAQRYRKKILKYNKNIYKSTKSL
jgi:K+-transporting ATPase c subunit